MIYILLPTILCLFTWKSILVNCVDGLSTSHARVGTIGPNSLLTLSSSVDAWGMVTEINKQNLQSLKSQ